MIQLHACIARMCHARATFQKAPTTKARHSSNCYTCEKKYPSLYQTRRHSNLVQAATHLWLTPKTLPNLAFCTIGCNNEATSGPGRAIFSSMFMFSTFTGCFLTLPFFKCEHNQRDPDFALGPDRLVPHTGLACQSNPEIHKAVGFLCDAEYCHVHHPRQRMSGYGC